MRISIVGTGHVGLVTGCGLASAGHQVRLVDIDAARVRAINQDRAPFYEPGLEALLAKTLKDKRVEATTDLRRAVAESEVTFICVGTPLRDGGIDLDHLKKASEQVGEALRAAQGYHVVVIKSTVVPGTTDTVVRPIVEQASGRRPGEVGFCMNPEFLREGSAVQDVLEPDRVIIGESDDRAGQTLAEVYQPFDCPQMVRTTLRNAELIKYASNALLATLISFSNEIAALCEATPGTDAAAVLSGVHLDRRLSPIIHGARLSPGILDYLRAGCGFGGSCLPKDVAALRRYAKERDVPLHVLDAVIKVNAERPGRLVAIAEQALGSFHGTTVAVLGLAFKPGTDDLRDSPSLAVVECLLQKGASVRVYDPFALEAARPLLDPRVAPCETPEQAFEQTDAALVVTAWPEFAGWDWRALTGRMRRPIIVDGRNALQAVTFPDGVIYRPIGRMPEPVNELQPR